MNPASNFYVKTTENHSNGSKVVPKGVSKAFFFSFRAPVACFGVLGEPGYPKLIPKGFKMNPGAPKSEVWGTPGASKKNTSCCFLCPFLLLFLPFFLFLFSPSPSLFPSPSPSPYLSLSLSLFVLDLVWVLVRHGGGLARRALGLIMVSTYPPPSKSYYPI